MKCPACKKQLYRAEIEKNLSVCNKCDHHMRIGARDRLNQFLDQESQTELFPNIVSVDPKRLLAKMMLFWLWKVP